MSSPPQAIILAGPNGAGKSTARPRLIPPGINFVNADDIARELIESGQASAQGADIAAGRQLIVRLNALEEAQADFAVETNLANRSLAQRIPRWQKEGYRVAVYYLWVSSPDLAVARVAERVRMGGHNAQRIRYDVVILLACRTFFGSTRHYLTVGLCSIILRQADHVSLSAEYEKLRIVPYGIECGGWRLTKGETKMETLDKSVFLEDTDEADEAIERAMQLAVRDAMREHKRRGNSVAVWRDGKMVILSPEEIQIPDNDNDLLPLR